MLIWRRSLPKCNKDPYLDAKNHPTLDVITTASFYIEMSENHQMFDEICTLPKVHVWIQVLSKKPSHLESPYSI